jgi:hypothetical protein
VERHYALDEAVDSEITNPLKKIRKLAVRNFMLNNFRTADESDIPFMSLLDGKRFCDTLDKLVKANNKPYNDSTAPGCLDLDQPHIRTLIAESIDIEKCIQVGKNPFKAYFYKFNFEHKGEHIHTLTFSASTGIPAMRNAVYKASLAHREWSMEQFNKNTAPSGTVSVVASTSSGTPHSHTDKQSQNMAHQTPGNNGGHSR